MQFTSLEFCTFFAVVFCCYWALPWKRARVWLLLVASYYFYMSWNAQLAAVICASSAVDYFIGRALGAVEKRRARKALLILSISMNLGLLCYFKYANFFLDSLERALTAGGFAVSLPLLKVVLPIGISFYTFEAISYTVDVYRRIVRPERNLANFLLFISFFPRMVAGPIIRARRFLPQVDRPKRWDWARMDAGVQLVLLGVFKKLAVADRMALLVDPVFAAPTHYCSSTLWIADIAYAVQIYCDFSGYSDMALGTAALLGFKLPRNFDMPYLAPNIAAFWRRWHISLSSWLRDYVYFPLGGNRGSKWHQVAVVLFTMTLCGFWHGADWTFLLFGTTQGAMLIVHRWFEGFASRHGRLDAFLQTAAGTTLRVLFNFTTFCVSVVVFRAVNLPTAGTILQGMFWPQDGLRVKFPVGPWSLIFSMAVLGLGYALYQSRFWTRMGPRLPVPILGLAYSAMLFFTFYIMPVEVKSFIYFQF